MAEPKLVKVTVHERRTLVHDGKVYRGGAALELPEDDARTLMKGGFLVDPTAEPPPVQKGPKVGQVGTETR